MAFNLKHAKYFWKGRLANLTRRMKSEELFGRMLDDRMPSDLSCHSSWSRIAWLLVVPDTVEAIHDGFEVGHLTNLKWSYNS